jgi:SAM-dependent methyltransferase
MGQEFDYDRHTRLRYQDPAYARRYHSRFSATRGWWRQRYVARQERRTLKKLIEHYMPGVVLDLPCGSGKLAPVFADVEADVIAADISPHMIDIARGEYEGWGPKTVEFVTCDAESVVGLFGQREIDVLCCVRLMHRVPVEVRRTVLSGFAQVAPVSLVSYSIDSRSQNIRRRILGSSKKMPDDARRQCVEAELDMDFKILDAVPISPAICSEWFFLLSSRYF